MTETKMMRPSTKDKSVHLEAIVGILQPDLESLAENKEINSIKIPSVRLTCTEFVNEFLDKLNKMIRMLLH